MITQRDFETWEELEKFSLQLSSDAHPAESERSSGYYSDLLFRGQANHEWFLETTLQRASPNLVYLSDYYRIVAIAQTHIESMSPVRWQEVNYPEIAEELSNYDAFTLKPLPHYPYLVHLRHHGFPSLLLDWSRSLYIAAFFAFQQPQGSRIAIFAYQEHAGHGKAGSSNKPQIHTLGRNIRTHPRHFHQQAEYTTALQFNGGNWHLANHIDICNSTDQEQDKIWKLTAPSSCRNEVLKQLEMYNITAYSLFQTEEALLATLANRLLPLKK